ILRVLDRVAKGYVLRRDFALSAGGGQIFHPLTSTSTLSIYIALKRGVLQLFASPRQQPEAVIAEGVGPGDCWRFSGATAHVGIVLAEPIFITHVSIDHIPRTFTSNIRTAPKDMVLWGVVEGQSNIEALTSRTPRIPVTWNSKVNTSAPFLGDGRQLFPLASFTYDIEAYFHVQTFRVWNGPRTSDVDIGVVILEVLSNWGEADTCLYRVRIHGD
ncbi:hypothetical protein BV25DRAFT_1771898, partial [Artomyces pyxidatus]